MASRVHTRPGVRAPDGPDPAAASSPPRQAYAMGLWIFPAWCAESPGSGLDQYLRNPDAAAFFGCVASLGYDRCCRSVDSRGLDPGGGGAGVREDGQFGNLVQEGRWTDARLGLVRLDRNSRIRRAALHRARTSLGRDGRASL